jgi:class 3 adenylate cyclase/tetratricopeptide (TPR) repeat protein
VSVCPACGHGYQAGAKFCPECGAALRTAPLSAQEERKIVTVLFADLVGFTSRAEQMDPEDVRAVLSPYYGRLRAELERFGGTVEKFIGDAVMALFGAPAGHEDDPERAVRAALAICDWARGEGRTQVRVGVNTGEALITLGARPDVGEGMAAGDVVNTAARLQTAAPVNGILVGERTFRATRRVIEYRPAMPVSAKGKRAAVSVWEALAARPRPGVDVPEQAGTALVDRDRELAVLAGALAGVRADRSLRLVTLVGAPGIGKSRLVFELRKMADAETGLISWRQGRSLPYGERVTFGALAEMVKAQAGILDSDTPGQAEVKLAEMTAQVLPGTVEARWVVRHLGALAGLGGGPAAGERGEMFAAWRHFFQALAERRPLVLVFEDLHWADDGLLDFADYLADSASEAPLLVIGTTRPELLARRPGWGDAKRHAVTVALAPLSDGDTARLIGLLSGRAVLRAGQQAALVGQVGGNPLYAEQYMQMLAERGTGEELPVPESVQAVIGARLDLLAPSEKRLLHDAAVIGNVFWTGAVTALSATPGDGQLDQQLHKLEDKQFIRRQRASSVPGEPQYAFAHVLVRDVAYGQIPRAARAGKHVQAAGWIKSLGRAEDHAEMLAHHYLSALDVARAAGQDTADLTAPARAALRAAGDRAFALNAFAPAAEYYRAALALWPQDALGQRARLLRVLGTVLFEGGDLGEAEAVLAEGSEVAAAAGLPAMRARMGVLLAEIHNQQGRGDAEALAECEAAAAVLESEGDVDGLAEAWVVIGKLRFFSGDWPADQQALERALTLARQCGNRRAQMRATQWLILSFGQLSVPADAAIGRAEQLIRAASGDPWAEALLLEPTSLLYAYVGRFADARAAIARARSVFAGFGAKFAWAESALLAGQAELIAGDPVAAERYLREGFDAFHAMGERGYLGTICGALAEALYAQGRLGDAQQATEQAEALAVGDDFDAQARWRAARAKLLARRGDFPAALALVEEAVALSSPTSWAVLQAEMLMAKAEVNRLAGRSDLAEASLREALRIYKDRHATALATQARTALATLTRQPDA